MTDKKTFGSFIKAKRTEKNYSQKDLAEMLFVTEGAVSKWERGISYPDITLISDICKVLDISEHEFITSSTDTAEREMKREAKKFPVFVALISNKCGGCRMEISASKLGQMKTNEYGVIECENCGRFIYKK